MAWATISRNSDVCKYSPLPTCPSMLRAPLARQNYLRSLAGPANDETLAPILMALSHLSDAQILAVSVKKVFGTERALIPLRCGCGLRDDNMWRDLHRASMLGGQGAFVLNI